ncbi:hypothetical protein GIW81_08555 [Hyphomicrobium sp. xq]|uniref:Secretin/TonB short N-terminal domain-containing protein n=1 Tax=Hyphomicrobium album TaxID=2665159 RepID=A0A6I3KJ79_9HYPH|nr:STN domain-containing protein [Hyphomicrobium album]MTD94383.1 hypothetical protein [Hyphomicrobium album]
MPDAAVSAQCRSRWLCRALTSVLALTWLGYGALSQTTPPRHFAIVAQPLAVALNTYSTVSGIELYYDGEFALGQLSSPIEGVLAPEQALRQLLVGTGLIARSTGPSSITITPARPSRIADTSVQSYFAAIQVRVSQVLCARTETRPGSADLLIQLWLTPAGAVQRATLLDAPDDRRRSEAFAAALQGVRIGAPPPGGMPQPINMAVLARADGEPTGCARSTTTAAR